VLCSSQDHLRIETHDLDYPIVCQCKKHRHKVLDNFDANFASDARNVQFGWVTDGFDPFRTDSTPYSCWPVFAMTYNLPPLSKRFYDTSTSTATRASRCGSLLEGLRSLELIAMDEAW
jgi:hypothetical protein